MLQRKNTIKADFEGTIGRKDCLKLAWDSANKQQPMTQIESLIYFGKFVAFERMLPRENTDTQTLLEEGRVQLDVAREMMASHPSTISMSDEIETTEKMLRESTFYTVVTSAERQAIYMAMAQDFRGTGHWYYCVNMHAVSPWRSCQTAKKPAC